MFPNALKGLRDWIRGAPISSPNPVASVTWTTLSNNRTPSFLIDATNWLPTDIFDFQIDTSTSFDSSVSTNIGAIIGLPATVTSDILADGTYYARARIERGSTAYAWSSTITFNIAYLGPAPTVADTSASVDRNTAKAIDVSTLISGASHTSVAVSDAPAHGTTSVSGDVITYTPATGYSGPDSFTYVAVGPGGTSNKGTVTIGVSAQSKIDSSTTFFTSSTTRIY